VQVFVLVIIVGLEDGLCFLSVGRILISSRVPAHARLLQAGGLTDEVRAKKE